MITLPFKSSVKEHSRVKFLNKNSWISLTKKLAKMKSMEMVVLFKKFLTLFKKKLKTCGNFLKVRFLNFLSFKKFQ